VAFLIMMALGHLPALFALPAGLGGIAAGMAAPLVAYNLRAVQIPADATASYWPAYCRK